MAIAIWKGRDKKWGRSIILHFVSELTRWIETNGGMCYNTPCSKQEIDKGTEGNGPKRFFVAVFVALFVPICYNDNAYDMTRGDLEE